MVLYCLEVLEQKGMQIDKRNLPRQPRTALNYKQDKAADVDTSKSQLSTVVSSKFKDLVFQLRHSAYNTHNVQSEFQVVALS